MPNTLECWTHTHTHTVKEEKASASDWVSVGDGAYGGILIRCHLNLMSNVNPVFRIATQIQNSPRSVQIDRKQPNVSWILVFSFFKFVVDSFFFFPILVESVILNNISFAHMQSIDWQEKQIYKFSSSEFFFLACLPFDNRITKVLLELLQIKEKNFNVAIKISWIKPSERVQFILADVCVEWMQGLNSCISEKKKIHFEWLQFHLTIFYSRFVSFHFCRQFCVFFLRFVISRLQLLLYMRCCQAIHTSKFNGKI